MAAAAGAAGLAGCGGGSPDPWNGSPPEARPGLGATADAWGFDEVVDLVDAGADPTGTKPLGPVLDEAAGDGTLLYLQPGRYHLEETWYYPEFSSFGIVGDRATIVPPQGFDSQLLVLGVPGKASRVLVEGLRFDLSAKRTGARPVAARVDDELVLRDVTVRGRQDVDTDTVRVDVASPDGVGLVERLRLPDGSVSTWPITGCEIGDDTNGDISFVDCRIEGFSDNGLYADPPKGRVRVLGGYYANNEVASVRVNAGPGSLVRGVHVRCDTAREGFLNMRGIRLRGGRDVLVEDCLVEMLEVSASDGAVVFSPQQRSGTVRDCRIRVDADGVNAIRIKEPNGGLLDGGDGPILIENVVITGNAATGPAVMASDRDNCVFDGVCLHQPGNERGGVRAHRVNGAIRNSYLAATDYPYRLLSSDVKLADVDVRKLAVDAPPAPGDGCG